MHTSNTGNTVDSQRNLHNKHEAISALKGVRTSSQPLQHQKLSIMAASRTRKRPTKMTMRYTEVNCQREQRTKILLHYVYCS